MSIVVLVQGHELGSGQAVVEIEATKTRRVGSLASGASARCER